MDLSIGRSGHNGRVPLEECYLFTRQLAVLQRAGVPLLSSLHALKDQLGAGPLQHVLERVRQDLLEGCTFSQALARHPRAFSPVYLGLTRVGESGGVLSEILDQLTGLLEWELELREQIRSALQYPMIVLGTLGVAVSIMAVFVLPRFAEMFASFRIALPLQTRLLIGLSHVVSRYGWLMLLGAAGLAAGVWTWVRTTAGRRAWDTWQLRLPVVGPLIAQLAMSRIARILAALNHSGVPILETLELAGGTVGNVYLSERLAAVQARVREGQPLAAAMRAEPVFPPIVVQMVATGEETGKLDELLSSVSAYYDHQATHALKRMITYVEPVLLVVVGLGVLLLATAVFVPMWDLVKIFKTAGR